MADLIDYGIAFISKVIEVCDDVKENKAKSRCLKEQWIRVQENISRANTGASSYKKSLDAMRALADETIAFLSKFKHKSYVRKAWNHSSDKGTFEDLSKRLNVLMQEMQLGCALDTQELLASHARSHTVDVGEIGESIAESEGRLAESQRGMEATLLAAVRKAEEAARQSGGGAAVVADEVRKQVSEALAQQSQELNRTLNARSQADQAEVQQLLLETKQAIIQKMTEAAASLPDGVSEEALRAALSVERGDIADIRRLEDSVYEQAENSRDHLEEQLKDLKKDLVDAMKGGGQDASALRTRIAELQDQLARAARLGESQHYVKVDRQRSPVDSDDEDEAELGRGAFGKTYRMLHDDGSLRAVKVIHVATAEKKGVSIAKLEAEARNMELLRHENIVAYYGKLYTGSKKNPKKFFWIVMELVEGETLFSKIGSDLSAATLVGWLLQIGKALAYMHKDKHMLHRDIKLDNIMVTADGTIKLIDLGLAAVQQSSVGMTSSAKGAGTAAYASKEKFSGKLYGPEDDMWAVGCGLGELITREPLKGALWSNEPLQREFIEAARRLDPRLGEAARHLLNPDPRRRIPAAALVQLLSGPLPPALPPPSPSPAAAVTAEPPLPPAPESETMKELKARLDAAKNA